MPFIPPMFCSRLERPERLAHRRYIAEPKLDGQRTQVHIRYGRTSVDGIKALVDGTSVSRNRST
jgi:ATP-dependent DNA ligase